MLPYQEKYIANLRLIAELSDFYRVPITDFESWYAAQRRAGEKIEALRREDNALLERELFPLLDDLHNASPAQIAELEAFGDALMDWVTNLDIGVYVLIHDALLSLYRIRRDRDRIIKELYKLGMGQFYLRRMVQGLDDRHTRSFSFQNELLFTEAGSYLKYFARIENEETKGYIIRALANVAIATQDRKRRVAASGKVLQISKDPYYRELAPGLPWDVFYRRTLQQMSANRDVFSKGNLNSEELAAVLDACHQVFTPEEGAENPNIRWLWPYYEMEYSCGFVDLNTTLDRLERIIMSVEYDEYDESGMYGNIQLPIYYGRLLRDNPAVQEEPRRVAFLRLAYEKMLRSMLTFPVEQFTDQFVYTQSLVYTGYLELPDLVSYREISRRLMQRFAGRLYIRSHRVGALLRCLCEAIFAEEPDFFDDIPFLAVIQDPAEKRAALLDYAEGCGLFHDFGLIKMSVERTELSRGLFENEYQMHKLHTLGGHDDLAARPSTAIFADVALGHHAWYNGSAEGWPAAYVRNESPYRQMTDAVSVAAYLVEQWEGDAEKLFREVQSRGNSQFSPLITAWFTDRTLRERLAAVLQAGEEDYYREVWEQLVNGQGTMEG